MKSVAPEKRRAFDAGNGAGDFDGGEVRTPVKRRAVDAGNGVGYFDGSEAGAVGKCRAADAGDGATYGERFQGFEIIVIAQIAPQIQGGYRAFVENAALYGQFFLTVFYYEVAQAGAPVKRGIPDASDGVAYFDGGEAVAPAKRSQSDTCYGVGDFDGREAGAPAKRGIPDANDGVAYFDGGEAVAPAKRVLSDAGDGVAYFDGGEVGIPIKRFIPDAGDGISRAVVNDGRRDNCGRKVGRTTGYFAGLVLGGEDGVVEAILREIVGEYRLRRGEEEREERD